MLDSSIVRYKQHLRPQLVPSDGNIFQSGYFIDHMGSSDDVLSFFNRITMVQEGKAYAQNEAKLATLLMRFTHDGACLSLQQLREINDDVMEEDCIYLNKICYHMLVKRVVRWVVSFREENQHLALPIASAQARVLVLVQNGILTFAEAFGKNSSYGIFYSSEYTSSIAQEEQDMKILTTDASNSSSTGGGGGSGGVGASVRITIQAMRLKIKRINALYQKYIVEMEPTNFLPTIQFWKQHERGATLPTYTRLHTELCRMYGGEIDEGADLEIISSTYGAVDSAIEALFDQIKI